MEESSTGAWRASYGLANALRELATSRETTMQGTEAGLVFIALPPEKMWSERQRRPRPTRSILKQPSRNVKRPIFNNNE